MKKLNKILIKILFILEMSKNLLYQLADFIN